MTSQLVKGNRALVFFLAVMGIAFISCARQDKSKTLPASEINEQLLKVDTIPSLNSTKLALTKQYCLENYGVASYKLDSPKIILVHFTVFPTLEETIKYFQKDSIESSRTNISKFSQMNVGIHYIVDKDGSIYKLVPDTVIARHAIGFNHIAIGIENIAKDASELTAAQLESNAKLIALLKKRNAGIEYLVGHHEYNDTTLAHYELFLAVNEAYKPHDKPDPGNEFMAKLRGKLESDYDLTFMK